MSSGCHGPIDAVIVLGAAVLRPGVPGPALQRRLNTGVATFRRVGARHLVLSGGIVAHPPAEAEVMRRLALAQGVAEEAIIVEPRARNTFENALYCGRILRERAWQRVIVVTDGWHLGRALYAFRRLGLAVSGVAVPRPRGVAAWRWWLHYGRDGLRRVGSWYLFQRGRHRPRVAAEWGIEIR
jgi:uncharacterized SAM-binding protein YcdF (DUF218 family)